MTDPDSITPQGFATAAPVPDADTTHLLLIRHGSTTWNEAKPPRLQGSGVDLELSPSGLKQSTALGQALQRFRLAKIYCSHLKRAQQTAAAIAHAQKGSVEVLDNLQEIHVGQWEGYDWDRIGREFPEEYRQFWADYGSRAYLGGESFQQVLARSEPVLLDLLEKHRGETIAVVAHGIVNRIFLTKYLGCAFNSVREIPQFNCCVNVLRGRQGNVQVVSINSVLHIDDWPA